MADDLSGWLESVGLGQCVAQFTAQGIDWDVLGDLNEAELAELGLTLGDRKRLAKALMARSGGGATAAVAKGDGAAVSGMAANAVVAVPPAAHPAAVEAERRQLTVMFIDLIDSSPLAERFDPEEMRAVLRVFHQACVSAIEAHEGHIAQYSGDGLMVYFGYPKAHEDDAVRGVLAGLDIIANLRVANDRLEAENGVRLLVRIGVETGLVVAGEVGAGASLDRQAIVGETPIVAARLQTLAPPDTVVVGPATERLIQGSFSLEAMGPRALKGVSGALEIYRVLGRSEAEGSFEIRAGRGLTPLIGRTAELEMMRQRWNQSRDGEMRCVLLVGEPGIGKSRTLSAFRDAIAADGHEAVTFHCASYYQDSPFWPVLQRLQRSFGLDPKSFDAASVDHLEAALGRFGIDTAEAALVLSNLLGMPQCDRYPAIDTAAPAFKRRCLNVLVAIVEAMSRAAPVLLVVEDAHWIDPSTLELVRLLLERLTAARMMVVITARPEFKPDWAYPHLVQLNLDRLSRRDRQEMVELMTGGKALPPQVLAEIVAKTDGVPLFVEELTKMVLQGDLLRETDGGYVLRGASQAMAIPDTLQGSLLSRLDRLAPGVKEVAQIAATLGREFDRGLLAAIAGKPEAELDAALEQLTAAEIIVPASGAANDAWFFRHALIQDIAYQSLLLTRRRQFHGRIAGALEASYPEVVERQPERLAQNYAASETPVRAVDYWRRAGERALAGAAFQEAIAHAEAGVGQLEGLRLADEERDGLLLPLLMVRGRGEYGLGDRRSIRTFAAAAQTARTRKLWPEFAEAAMEFESGMTFLEGAPDAGVGILEEALAQTGKGDTVARSRLMSRLASALHRTGAFERAAEITGQAVALARRVGDPSGVFDALTCELMGVGAGPLPSAGFPRRLEVLEELTTIADAQHDEAMISHICGRALTGYLETGDYPRFQAVMESYRKAAARGQAMIHGWILASAEAMQAIMTGDFAEAERLADAAMAVAESLDASMPAGVYGMQMFTIRREQGRLAEVAPLIKRFMDENPEETAWRPGLMLIASDLGFEAQALRNLEMIAGGEVAIPVDNKRLITLTYIAEVAARLTGQPEHAERVYAQLLPFADQAVTVPASTLCCGAAARYLGQLAGTLGDWKAAEAHFEYALELNERLQARPWLAHTRHDYAVMLSARGRKQDQERAMALTAQAAEAAQAMNMSALMGRITGAGSRPSN